MWIIKITVFKNSFKITRINSSLFNNCITVKLGQTNNLQTIARKQREHNASGVYFTKGKSNCKAGVGRQISYPWIRNHKKGMLWAYNLRHKFPKCERYLKIFCCPNHSFWTRSGRCVPGGLKGPLQHLWCLESLNLMSYSHYLVNLTSPLHKTLEVTFPTGRLFWNSQVVLCATPFDSYLLSITASYF